MKALDRKLLRDMLHMKGQLIAIGLVMACGVATFVMSGSALDALSGTQQRYYDRYRFAHVFANLKRAPLSLVPRIEALPGVSQVQTRVVRDVNLDVPGMTEPAVGRLISIPERPVSDLNAMHLRNGRYIEPGRAGEVLVSEGFALAHKFAPGDTVAAIINGRRQLLRIVGVALSPEYVYQIRPGQLIPDDLRFGIFWMGREQLDAAFDMDGAFNDVTLTLMRNASEEEVLARLDDLLEPYGGLGAYTRKDQVSNRFVSDEIAQIRRMNLIVPSIFLGVAAFLLNVVLARIISLQRDQIAALKAFGYSNWAVGWHYLKLVLLLAIMGVVLGTAVGSWLGYQVTKLYTQFYRFPALEFALPPRVLALSVLVSAGAAMIGTLSVIRQAVRLPPAEAMRPEPPAVYRPTVVERLGLTRLFTQPARMVLRHIERRPVKSFFSAFGMGLSIAILIVGRFPANAFDYLLEMQFQVVQRQDLTVSFFEATSIDALFEVQHLPGVINAEPFRSVPARLRFENHHRRVSILGLPPGTDLNHLVNSQFQPVALPPEGVLLNTKLAELLNVQPGDTLTVEVLEGERPVRQLPVAALTTEYLGTSAYMNLSALNAFLREGPSISGLYLSADSRHADELYQKLKETPRVAAVTIQQAAIRSFRQTVMENMLKMQMFNLMFACVIAFGVVYNTARLALSERGRELASLRVIGFTRAEISFILLGELAVLTLLAIPLGLALGYGLARFLTLFLDTELYRVPLVINLSTYAFATSVVIGAAILSGLVVRRRLDHLDLVAVLKTRE